MKIEILVNVKNLEELKIEFRKFAFLLHPDKGGNIEEFKKLNNEYQYLIKNLALYSKEQKSTNDNVNDNANDLEEFQNIINELIIFSDIEIEVIQKFIWVKTAKNHPANEKLKELKFKFASNKKLWYYHNIKNYRSFGKKDIEEIRSKYGTKKVEFNKVKKY
jgi:curved DNA-binding protein CbpA